MKHPIHPMIVHFPIVGWTVTFFLDMYQYIYGVQWADLTQFVVVSSCIMAVIAMAAGLMDYLRQKPEQANARRIEQHMYWALALFAAFSFRALLPTMLTSQLLLWSLLTSAVGFVLLIYTSYLGGHLVYTHGLGGVAHFKKQPKSKD